MFFPHECIEFPTCPQRAAAAERTAALTGFAAPGFD